MANTITINVTGIEQFRIKLNKISEIGRSNDFKNELGLALVSDLKEQFRTSKDPEGRSWAGVNYTKRTRSGSHERTTNPLLDNGTLVNSFNYQINGDTVSIGSPLKYAEAHDRGLKGQTRRRIISYDSFNNTNFYNSFEEIVDRYLQGIA